MLEFTMILDYFNSRWTATRMTKGDLPDVCERKQGSCSAKWDEITGMPEMFSMRSPPIHSVRPVNSIHAILSSCLLLPGFEILWGLVACSTMWRQSALVAATTLFISRYLWLNDRNNYRMFYFHTYSRVGQRYCKDTLMHNCCRHRTIERVERTWFPYTLLSWSAIPQGRLLDA